MAEVAVITGASAGIGRATAPEFASHGCSITLLARGCASAITTGVGQRASQVDCRRRRDGAGRGSGHSPAFGEKAMSLTAGANDGVDAR
jgi:NAD(P)-dependent dehydrogenase (short-subunit alcohol dehydrogenase family)